jgi:hypothetical protein
MMKKNLLGLFSLVLVSPFLGGNALSTGDLPKAGNFQAVLFATPQGVDKNYSFSLTYLPKNYSAKTSFLVTAHAMTQDSHGLPFLNSKILYSAPVKGLQDKDSLTIECFFPGKEKFLVDSPNANTLDIQAIPDPAYAPINVSVKINFVHPMAWKLPSSAPLARPYPTEWRESFDGSPGNYPYTIFHEGFLAQFDNPSRGVLPLKNMKLRNRFCDGSYLFFEASAITLKIKNHLSDFQVGEKKHDEKTEWFEIPLSFIPENNGSWGHLVLKDEVSVSMDERIMKKASQKGPHDFLTKNFYLPPVKNGEPKTYDFSILFANCGNQNLDSIEYDFSVFKSLNFLGSQTVSEWCVKEVD